MCAYSHDAALYNTSFLVRLNVPSTSPALHAEEVYCDYPITYDRAEYPACMHDGISDLVMADEPGLLQYSYIVIYRFEPPHSTILQLKIGLFVLLWILWFMSCVAMPGLCWFLCVTPFC